MGLLFYKWSRTAASNATADSNVNWAEGQAPSSVNDSARALMASAAGYRDDVAGAITTGGSATAYTVTSYQIFDTLANLGGQVIAFVPHATNTNAVGVDVTLNVDGLGAKSIRMQPSVALPNGTLVLGTPYVVVYNNSDAVFYLRNMVNPYLIPLGGMIDFIGPVSPNSSLVLPFGQAISRTTYATLFALVSTTYGVGDGSTTFNIPDFRGRVAGGRDSMGGTPAGRLSATYFGASSGLGGATLGDTGGAESITLQTSNLPAYTPAGTITNGAITSTTPQLGGVSGTGQPNVGQSIITTPATITITSSQAGSSFAGTAQGGTSTAFPRVPPMQIVNKLVRII